MPEARSEAVENGKPRPSRAELSEVAREMYAYLADRAERSEGNPLPKTVTMCDDLDLTRRSVQDALTELGESGLLQISRVYKIEPPKEAQRTVT